MPGVFDQNISYLKGIGPQRADLIGKELEIFTYGELLRFYPFRYEDRTKSYKVAELHEQMQNVQLIGSITNWSTVGTARKQRLVGHFRDDSGEIDLVWFQGARWVQQRIKLGVTYIVFGKPNRYGSQLSIAHPELEVFTEKRGGADYLFPVYSTTEKLKKKYVDSKVLRPAIQQLLRETYGSIHEILPANIIEKHRLVDRKVALAQIHFPKNDNSLQKARFRLKYEELFLTQVKLFQLKLARMDKFKGIVFDNSELLNHYYEQHLPFNLTNAQKRVIKEVYADFRSGHQMNRLVQGDVGSGKTMVAFFMHVNCHR